MAIALNIMGGGSRNILTPPSPVIQFHSHYLLITELCVTPLPYNWIFKLVPATSIIFLGMALTPITDFFPVPP